MSNYQAKPPVTKETMLACHGVAWIIQSSRNEQEAIRRICRFLNHWQYEITPGDLGSALEPRPQDP